MTTTAAPLTVFVVSGKRKPVKTDQTLPRDKKLPKTVQHNGGTFHFSTVDMVDNTITYVAVDPTWS